MAGRNVWRAGLPAVCLLALASCAPENYAEVSGTVTVDKTPLTTGMVTFHPVAGGPVAYGNIDAAGRYSLSTGSKRGLVSGEYIVTVVATEKPPAGTVKGPEPIGKLLTPERYGHKDKSTLKYTVTPGSNAIDLPLVSP
jgi:hypothetical protein